MYFDSFADFLAMGNHGLYVWLAYGFFLLVVGWNILMPVLEHRRVAASARRYWRRRGIAREGRG